MSPLVLQGNPGNEERQRRRSIFEEEKKKPSLLEKEIQLKINPKIFLRKSIFALLLISIFLAGRWSVDTSAANNTNENSFSILSFATSLFSSEKNVEKAAAPEAVPVAEVKENTPTGAVAAEPIPVNETTPTSAEENVAAPTELTEIPEPIISSGYSKVAVAITNVKHEKPNAEDENYVRITSFNYVIKNNEAGTIKPDYFILTIEGYDEEGDRREIPLTTEQKTVKAGQTGEGDIKIPPTGFAVNAATAGSLENVRISLVLLDVNEKPMASFTKEFNLKS